MKTKLQTVKNIAEYMFHTPQFILYHLYRSPYYLKAIKLKVNEKRV